ncbi:hypothetical protein T484DRAFT_1745833 [Baffinella frigidus]|nr:hypothetical protein T484DRAFT_1745833 [Cryptophyta sp. CCMP2293]
MFSLKTLALAAAIVGATAFTPVPSRSVSAPELRVAAPMISSRSRVVRSMSGDGTTTLPRPSFGTDILLRETKKKATFKNFEPAPQWTPPAGTALADCWCC